MWINPVSEQLTKKFTQKNYRSALEPTLQTLVKAIAAIWIRSQRSAGINIKNYEGGDNFIVLWIESWWNVHLAAPIKIMIITKKVSEKYVNIKPIKNSSWTK